MSPPWHRWTRCLALLLAVLGGAPLAAAPFRLTSFVAIAPPTAGAALTRSVSLVATATPGDGAAFTRFVSLVATATPGEGGAFTRFVSLVTTATPGEGAALARFVSLVTTATPGDGAPLLRSVSLAATGTPADDVVPSTGVSLAASRSPDDDAPAGDAPAPPPTRFVYLSAIGAPEDVAALEASLQDWLRVMELELRPVAELPAPGEPGAFARVQVTWSDDTCTVQVARGGGALVRRKLLPLGGPPLLVIEAAALVAQAAVQELSVEETRRRPLPTPAGASVVALADEPAAPASPVRLSLGAFLQGRSYDALSPAVLGGGAALAFGVQRGAWRPGGALLLAYQGPVARTSALASLQVQALSLRLGPTLWRRLGPLELSLGGGGGFDVQFAAASSTEVPVPFVRGTRADVAPFGAAWLGVEVPVASSVGLSLRVLVDFDPAPRRYLASVAGAETTLLEPWTVRPALQLGVTFDLLPGSRP